MVKGDRSLVEFAREVIKAYWEVLRERGRLAGPYVSFKLIAKRMEGKQRYGPWFRKWAEKMAKLRWRSLDGWCFNFLPYWGASMWNIWYHSKGEPTMFAGLGDHFLWLLDNEKYKAPPLET